MVTSKGYIWKTIALLAFFTCVSVKVEAQRNMPPLDFEQFRKDIAEIDSPEERLNRYVDVSMSVFRHHPDSLFAFADEIRNLKGLEPARQKAFEQFFLAHAWRPFNRDSAIYYGIRAAERLKKANEHEQYLRTENLLGLEYSRKPDYLSAEAAFLEGISYSKSVDTTYYPIHYFYGNLGNLYANVGAYDLSVKMFEKFMEYADNPADRCNILSRLAGNLMKMDELEKAEQMLLPCLGYAELPPPIRSIVRSNLSEITGKRGLANRSLELMEQASSISSKHRVPNLHIAHLIRLGNQYLDMNRVQQADSIRMLIENTDFRGINRHFTIEKVLFFSKLALARGDHQHSIVFADSAIQTAGSNDDLRQFLGKVYVTKAQAYEHLGKMDQAVKNLRLQDKLDEQLLSKERIRNEAMMKIRYQLQNKENELALITNRLSMLNTQNFLLLTLVIIVGLAGGFIYSRYRKSRKKEQSVVTELQKREVTISELEQKIAEQNRKLKERNIPDWVDINSQLKLSLYEIRYIQSEGNYVKIYLSDTERAPIMERLTLKQCEEILPDEISLRIHRSTIVNMLHVSHIVDEIMFLKDNTELKISRRYKKELADFLT